MYILEDLKDDETKNMALELTEAIMKVLENTDKETQRKPIRAIMRYRNFSGLDLEKAVKKKLELQKKSLRTEKHLANHSGAKKRRNNGEAIMEDEDTFLKE